MSCIALTLAAAKMMVCCFQSSSTGNEAMWGEKFISDNENYTSETAPDDEMHVASSFFLAAAGKQMIARLRSFVIY